MAPARACRGPGAVTVGVSTYKALAATLKLVCGGVFQRIGTTLGRKLETKYETAIAIDIVRHGKCLSLKQRLGQLSRSAVKCKNSSPSPKPQFTAA